MGRLHSNCFHSNVTECAFVVVVVVVVVVVAVVGVSYIKMFSVAMEMQQWVVFVHFPATKYFLLLLTVIIFKYC